MRSKKNNKSNICYTGVGAKKKGTHTRDEFMKVMKKNGKLGCSKHKRSLKCKPCKERKKILYKIKKSKNKLKSKKLMEKEEKLFDDCLDCQEHLNDSDICDFYDYIKWSGAEFGKCKI